MSSIDPTVALVSTQRRWHGGEEQARLLAVGLRRRGWRCALLARRGGQFARRMADEGFEVFTFPGGGRNPAALWTIRRALGNVRPAVLHYNDSHAVAGAGLASAGLRIPARVAARRVDFPIRSAKKYRRFCDRVVCVSTAVAEVCRRDGLPENMLRLVHDGVDPARVRSGDRTRGRRALGLAEGQTLLLTIATLTEHKGHRFLVEAMPEVVREFPNAVLALAGDGDLRETLRRRAERLGVERHVRFLGFRDDVPDLIRAADLFVLPSLTEGLCSTLIDVMLADRSIVAAAAGGIPDLLGGSGKGDSRLLCQAPGFGKGDSHLLCQAPGFGKGDSHLLCQAPEGPFRQKVAVTFSEPVARLVPPGDSQALGKAIVQALNSPDESAEMRRRALVRAEKYFTADRMVENTLAVYGTAIKGSGVFLGTA